MTFFFCCRSWLCYNHFQILPLTRINQPMLSSGLLWPDCCQYESLFKSSWGISALLRRYRCLTFHYQSFMLASSTWLNWNLFNIPNAAEWTILETRLSSVYLLLGWQVLLASTVNYCLPLLQQSLLLLEHFSPGRAFSSSSTLRLLFVLLLVWLSNHSELRTVTSLFLDVQACSTVLAGPHRADRMAWKIPGPLNAVAGRDHEAVAMVLLYILLSCAFAVFKHWTPALLKPGGLVDT